MLKRIYIDNYKSLVNAELKVNTINLFLGANGSGKSAVFEVLRAIQDFVCVGSKATDVLDAKSLTRWQNSSLQTFELDIKGPEGLYKYELVIEHLEGEQRARVQREHLFFDDKPLLRLEKGEVHLHRDDHSAGPTFPIERTLSAVGAIPLRHDNTRLTWFRERLARFIVVQIIPPMMFEESPQEDSQLSPYMENFTSWYRHVSQDQGMTFQLMNELKEVIPGFDSFKFQQVGEKHRLLNVFFSNEGTRAPTGYHFGELADGQRMLIALYTLLYAARVDQDHEYTLCLDEPENFVALSEIQPWLTALYDSCTDGQMQALLISHHPELMDYLLASPVGYWFERQGNRPTRIKPVSAVGKGGLPISEIVARGWLNEPVNEKDTYRKLENEGACKPVVAELAKRRREPLPEGAPSSLEAACGELPRIL